MAFVSFNLVMLLASFAALLVLAIGFVVTLAPFSIASRLRAPRGALYPLLAMSGAFQLFFWGLWAAFCVAVTMKYTQRPEVTWDWLYWVAAFSWCTSLIGWLWFKESQTVASVDDVRRVDRGATWYSLATVGAFLAFAFFPAAMNAPYGWVLDPLRISPNDRTSTSPAQEKAQPEWPPVPASVGFFFDANDRLNRVTVILQEIFVAGDTSRLMTRLDSVRLLLDQSLGLVDQIDTDTLNAIYPGWGDHFSAEYTPAVRGYHSGFTRNEPEAAMGADSYILRWNSWLGTHRKYLLTAIAERYGLETR